MAYRFLRRTILPRLVRRISVEGLEYLPTRGPYLIAANHQSYLDGLMIVFPVVLHRDEKIWFLTTEHIWKFFSWFGGHRVIDWLGMIPIRANQKADALKPALDILRRQGIVGIFPEGSRNKPSLNPDWRTVLLHGKTGLARLALQSGAPVIPAGLVAPQGFTAWQAIVNFLRRRQPAIVRFGQPIQFQARDVSTVGKAELDVITRQVMFEVGRLCGKTYPPEVR